MRTLSFFLCLMLLLPSFALAEERLHQSTNWIQTDKVTIQGLDKVSARVFTAEVYLNQKVHFGSLEVYAKSCKKAPPEEQPESICFVEIFDNKPGQQRQQVFSGWMFASNPALSALEHPVYDVWIKEATTSPIEKSNNAQTLRRTGNVPEKDTKDSEDTEDTEE